MGRGPLLGPVPCDGPVMLCPLVMEPVDIQKMDLVCYDLPDGPVNFACDYQ